MSFDTAIDFLKTYRQDRTAALNNERRQRWSTQPLDTVGELFTDVFSTTEENAEWETAYKATGGAKPDKRKLQAMQMKIPFLAGCRRDLRIVFSAWSDNRVRVALDQDRFEQGNLTFRRFKMDTLSQVIKGKEQA